MTREIKKGQYTTDAPSPTRPPKPVPPPPMEPRLRRFSPLTEASLLVGAPCEACHEVFKVGESLTLIELGPGKSAEERNKARALRPYNAVALPIHWACATGFEE